VILHEDRGETNLTRIQVSQVKSITRKIVNLRRLTLVRISVNLRLT